MWCSNFEVFVWVKKDVVHLPERKISSAAYEKGEISKVSGPTDLNYRQKL